MPIASFLRSLLLAVSLVLPLTEALSAQPGTPEPAAQHATIAIRAGRLLDVESGRVSTDQVILVRDGHIQAVGPNLKAPQNASLIDLSTQTVLPGLIDCHTHLADLADSEPLSLLRKSAVETAYAAIPNARLYVAGAYITISEGAGAMTGLPPDIQLPLDYRFGEANSPWEVRQKIRELAHRGADHIKILTTGAVLTHGSNPKSVEFTPEEIQAAVEEANNFGLRVEAHAHAAEGIKNAIRAGAASIEHATLIDDEGIALAKKRGTYLDMDIYDEECIQDQGKKNATPADFLEHDRDLGAIHRRNFA